MFYRNALLATIFAISVVLVLGGCESKTKALPDGTVVYTSPEAAQEAHMKKMKPVWDKYPEATTHSIVLDDGTKVSIPEATYPGKISDYKTMKAFRDFNKSRFDKATFQKIRAACRREESRFANLHNSYGLPLDPLSTLCFQAGQESQ